MIGDFFDGLGDPEPPHTLGFAVVPELTEAQWDTVEPLPATPPRVETHRAGDVVHGVGNPDAEAAFWEFQGYEPACAVVSQGTIIESLTGTPFDRAAATAWLGEQDWYDPAGGTRPADLTRLLDAHRVPCTAGPATIGQIWDALAAGDKVMVALDANEIWYPRTDPTTGQPQEWLRPAGHEVWVTGIEQTTSGGWRVVLNDSGHLGGRAESVALADFLNAWDDYGNHAVIAGGRSGPTAGAAGGPG